MGEVFDESVSVVLEDASEKRPQTYVAYLHSAVHNRCAYLCATYEWFEMGMTDLDVSVTLFDYDDVEAEKCDAVRELCMVARVYLYGGGLIEGRPRFLRRGASRRLTLEVNGRQWKLGRNWSSVPYP